MPIKNFSQYLLEEEREVYFTFGRMNPPTIGHGKVMDTLASKSGKSDYKVYLSHSQNPKKDPLTYEQKIKHVRKMFPKHARQVIMDKGVKNVFDVAAALYDQGYVKVNMVVGEDRIREFEVLLNKYNGKKARHGFYNFKSINIVSAGARDPDATGVEGMSASKQRDNASKNDFVTFSQGVPKTMSNKDARKLFNDVRTGMGLKETTEFKNHIELKPVSETREQYVQGDLYEVGDTVVVKENDELVKVAVLGANYVIIERTDGTRLRKWIDAVELIEKGSGKKQDPDIKDREGTQPARYHTGLKKSTKKARDAHFKKHGKKADDDDSAYKPAPGDATAKTKPSKYTKAFKDMYEEVSQKQLNDLERFADRLLAKFKVDIEFTRHFADRMNDDRNKPAITVAELQRVFKKIAKNKAKNIRQNPDSEAVIKDLQSDLNLPVVIKYDKNKEEFEVVNKTIMRKKDFKTSSKTITTEEMEISFEMCLKAETTPQMLKRWMSRTVQRKQYDQVAQYVKKQMDKEKGRHGPEYYASELVRKYGLKVDPKEVGRLVRSLGEDAVAQAQDKIAREKEADKKKHDKILDRARLARAKAKNRDTK